MATKNYTGMTLEYAIWFAKDKCTKTMRMASKSHAAAYVLQKHLFELADYVKALEAKVTEQGLEIQQLKEAQSGE